MVKNFGGNKSKRMGRKHVQTSTASNTRIANDAEGEIYGIITKIYGNGRAEILCIDGQSRILVIRKKFKGRNKRNNTVALNVWVMAGLRLWEVRSADSKDVCDLLEVYDVNDIEYLKNNVDKNWQPLIAASKSNNPTSEVLENYNEAEVAFTNQETMQMEALLNSEVADNEDANFDWLQDEDLDIDDI